MYLVEREGNPHGVLNIQARWMWDLSCGPPTPKLHRPHVYDYGGYLLLGCDYWGYEYHGYNNEIIIFQYATRKE